MKVSVNWKKTFICLMDVVIAGYLVMAITSWNKPVEKMSVCTKVDINIADTNNAGFLSAKEIKSILQQQNLYPLGKKMQSINPRNIEDMLKVSPFVNTAQCYKTKNGHVCMNVTQRLPIIRIKNSQGADYYLDDKGGTLPNSNYTSDLIIATGNVSRWFAKYYITPLAKAIMASDFWSNQIEQINVLPNKGIELVPRVGDQILFLGFLPREKRQAEREKAISDFANRKLSRLEKFYRYGLSQAGWNKYSYIDVEFDNQIICKKRTSNNENNNNIE